jgi:hypothetical protein
MNTSIETPHDTFQPRRFVFHINSMEDAARLDALLCTPAIGSYVFGYDQAIDESSRTCHLIGQPTVPASFRELRGQWGMKLNKLLQGAGVPSNGSPDQAAVLALAMSLYTAGVALNKIGEPGRVGNVYSGFDQYMRECMRLATEFETWCCEHVDFDNYTSMWVYDLDNFADTLTDLFTPAILLKLEEVKEAEFSQIANRMFKDNANAVVKNINTTLPV